MPAPSTASITVTGQLGPGFTITSKTFRNVSSINFDIGKSVLTIGYDNVFAEFDLYTIATVTYTISSHVGTVTVST